MCPASVYAVGIDAEKIDSISHFRAFPPPLLSENNITFTRHIVEDKSGYLWVSGGDRQLIRYDGYDVKSFDVKGYGVSGEYEISFLYRDNDDHLWIANQSLHKYDHKTETFSDTDVTGSRFIHTMTDDGAGNLWLGGAEFGFVKYDKKKNAVVTPDASELYENSPKFVTSMAYDELNKTLWMASSEGVFKYSVVNNTVSKIDTNLDKVFSTFYAKDISIDVNRNALWIATPEGLIRIDTEDNSVKIYTTDESENSLPIRFVTTTLIDTSGNLWIGLEKEGICLFRYLKDDFICLRSSSKGKYKIPFATVEDIYEDSSGSLWLSMNNKGLVRITPKLEKFSKLRDKFKDPVSDYFTHSFNGIVRQNGDIWIATDGGGINVFNYVTGSFRTIKSDDKNENSLPSNSVIAIAEDEEGYIWTGMWAGGVSRIDPETMEFKNYAHDPDLSSDQSLAGNNIFHIEPDGDGGLWISIWYRGLQYLKKDTGTFESYLINTANEKIMNGEISDVKLYNGKAWVLGRAGLETIDLKTHQNEVLITREQNFFTSIYIHSPEEFYLGSSAGFYIYNPNSGEKTHYGVKDGLSGPEVFYFFKDKRGSVWIATNIGVSVFDPVAKTFDRFYEEDGLVGNKMSEFGEFFEAGGYIYIPSLEGVSIVDPDDLPKNEFKPSTMISNIEYINTDGYSNSHKVEENEFDFFDGKEIPYSDNSLQFEFSILNFIFPHKNTFKYRLLGWQASFTETSALDRVARYTNLKPGRYTFEVFGATSKGVWDTKGASYSFVILPPWWSTWWAMVLFCLLSIAFIYGAMRWRLAVNILREKQLAKKVKEKTVQLEKYALDLKNTSDSLALLNTELEHRVETRTKELQVEVNERKVAESKLFHMAFHDSLTGLPNRQWLIQRVEKLLQRSEENPQLLFGLMFLDGDRFKQINDTHGHTVGDQLLIASAMRLSNLLSEFQHAARLGGDEFTVIVERLGSAADLEALANQVIDTFKQPFILDKNIIHFNVSIGLVVCDSRYSLVPSVLRDADIAMYRAKESGKGTYRVFDQDMRKVTLELAQLEAGLHEALEHQHFYLMYQPILDLSSGMISGFEALLRWEHPTRGNITPYEFIPIAEETGLIWQIGEWVLNESCRQTKQWHDMDIKFPPTISVNLSSNQLKNSTFLNVVDNAISTSGLDSRFLKLELTETVLIENNETISGFLDALRERHIDLAIDDFGTGYSSLAYLNEIPVQHIKIDRKFIDAIDNTANNSVNLDALEIVKATISLGQSLRKKVTAEGIESETQLNALREYGCDFAQGYFIAKPLLKEDATELLYVPETVKHKNSIDHKDDLLKRYQMALKNRRSRMRDALK